MDKRTLPLPSPEIPSGGSPGENPPMIVILLDEHRMPSQIMRPSTFDKLAVIQALGMAVSLMTLDKEDKSDPAESVSGPDEGEVPRSE